MTADSAEFITFLVREAQSALDHRSKVLSGPHSKAQKYYDGDAMPGDPGWNEGASKDNASDDGRSKVVSRDVAEVVDWSLPDLVRMFASKDIIAEFSAVRPDDEEAATQATDYNNHLFLNKNRGFLIMHDQMQDGLLFGLGVVRVSWGVRGEPTREIVQGLTQEQLTVLYTDDAVSILGAEQSDDGLFDVRFERTQEAGVLLETVKPGDFLLSPDVDDIDRASYVGMRVYKTLSDLRAEGFDVPDDVSDDATAGEDEYEDKADRKGPSRGVWVHDEYVRYDVDGDGVNELIHSVRVGRTLLKAEETPEQPFCIFSPKRRAHKAIGRSVAQDAFEIQEVKTALWRDLLDNSAFANAPQRYVNENGLGANTIDDLLTIRPGGIIRGKGGMSDVLGNLVTPDIAPSVLTAIEYADTAGERRTGVSRYNQGLDSESLNKTATGVSMTLEAGQAQRELVARLYEETLTSVFRKLHRLVVRHQRRPDDVKLRGEWITVDPRAWAVDLDVGVKVGARAASQEQRRSAAMGLLQVQREAYESGLVAPANLYAGLSRFVETLDVGPTETFFTEPQEGDQQQQQQPSPEEQKMQADIQLKQAELQIKQAEMQARIELEREKMAADIQLKREEMNIQFQLKSNEILLKGQTNENIRSPVRG